MKVSASELQEARAPIASLISKSEKAQLKLKPGTWQHTLLRDNLSALRIASALLNQEPSSIEQMATDELQEALRTLAAMIEKVEQTTHKFAPGTSQHSLQRNRLKALRIAEALAKAELEKRNACPGALAREKTLRIHSR